MFNQARAFGRQAEFQLIFCDVDKKGGGDILRPAYKKKQPKNGHFLAEMGVIENVAETDMN